MAEQVPVDDSAIAPDFDDDGMHQLVPDIAYKRLAIVNVVFFGMEAADGGSNPEWVLIDAGLKGTADMIADAAADRFGPNTPPLAIILTHGHTDHVGALEELVQRWEVPVYAHPLERPYLDGSTPYPPPDPRVGGGLMALSSPLLGRGPVNVSHQLHDLPADGAVPGMPRWRWLHTPGHTPGHVSLWRDDDKTLIVGDAFVTTKQESVYAVATQRPELHGPPMYFTTDWESARESVRVLARLNPDLVITGHGRPLHGEEMRRGLSVLARDFDRVARPEHGRYVESRAEITGGQTA
jgi:glyoxylase-like metal-dependent hydrolase (beta-lactamase superfamily II)